MRVVSFNSKVAYGNVGSNATRVGLGLFDIEITEIQTVNFSNHPGYGAFYGAYSSEESMAGQVESLEKLGLMAQTDAVISGYLGKESTITVVEKTVQLLKGTHKSVENRAHNEKNLNTDNIHTKNIAPVYVLDPIIGDSDTGIYVDKQVAEGIKSRLLPLADYITPNCFELSYLTDTVIETLEDAIGEGKKLLERFSLKGILVTSILDREHEIGMCLITKERCDFHYIPRLDFKFTPRGSGDFITAIFTAMILLNKKNKKILENLSTIIYNVFKQTQEKDSKELKLLMIRKEWTK